MRWLIQIAFLVFVTGNTWAQGSFKGTTAQSESLINIALEEVNKIYVAPPQEFRQLKSSKVSQSSIKVTYHNFPEEAKQAFQYAISIWESLLVSSVSIQLDAYWEDMGVNVLAEGRPSVFYRNFSGAPLRDTFYPVALAEKLTGKDLNGSEADIICQFNNKINWYFGTDGNTPSNKYDFVSSVLHEVTHGLGFSGFLKDSGGKGFFYSESNLPSIYDHYIFNYQNQKIADKSLFESPSYDLHKQLTSDNLKFCQTGSAEQYNTIDWIFAPEVWNEGSSIYHLKGYQYGEENSLMTPSARKGEAIHNPGEVTIQILAELGWSSVKFEFEPLKDIEQAVAEIPVEMGLVSDSDEDFSTVRVVYSSDNFSTANAAVLTQAGSASDFEGKLQLNYATGKVDYYIEVKTNEGRVFRNPADAPSRKFTLRIGPDYYVPDLFHNPVKAVAGTVSEVELSAEAKDNVGIKSVTVEYKINGVLQEPFSLETEQSGLYTGKLQFQNKMETTDRLEYRIIAIDNSSRGNKRMFPAMGFQKVEVGSIYEPVSGYATNFDGAENDFIVSDFGISSLNGIEGNLLHTKNPYPVSALEKEKFNLVAQLKYPVVVQSNGQLSFDEVVLVEPGSREVEQQLCDFVVIEASKDNGISWLPLTDEYDSGINDTWYTAFKSGFSNNTSEAQPHESLFVNRTINLTQSTSLEAGDTVLIRFRMASDNSVVGFGWAIDNLKIQEMTTATEELFAEGSFQVYPNPAKNHLYVEWFEADQNSPIEIVLSDLYGKIIRRETGIEPFYSSRAQIDLSGVSPGIYMVNITSGNQIVATNKIVKN
ncbi:Por secretion system C-terminal sorting domain-containing protein [Mariniphaga anaerophila]|uniref:Por secretion system C-terminal sorting domain-containing protein n=1 Tax=Mariniphaga anaerophila TaxID=1484053 RepID=A0A1M5CY03_9BACT|nr:T9SS type A sorting domain-containing protein [Mariniphaga anaerophila]SHF59643.1 Por secretion system C-terminal sorting domain-containing protein [Mariniphaga anaerophila]